MKCAQCPERANYNYKGIHYCPDHWAELLEEEDHHARKAGR